MKFLKIIVLAKQVPDTRNVGSNAMKEDGTVNRAALPAIFNPEDLNALEQALRIKEQVKGSKVYIVTMGPPRAADIIREGLYRGVDGGYLVTDKAFAGADTLATSYTLSKVIEKTGYCDLILAGRQAIDGDTAQVGPQVAEKLNIPQITYAEEIVKVDTQKIQVKRRLERGVEVVESGYPCLITVTDSAAECRVKNAKLIMKYKHAKTISESQTSSDEYMQLSKGRPYLEIVEMTANDLNADPNSLGLKGSPTKVKAVENVVLKTKESKNISSSNEDINEMIKELMSNHTIG